MDTESRTLLAIGALGVLIILLSVPWDISVEATGSPGVTEENFARLRRGMTERQVESILGKKGEIGLNTNDWVDFTKYWDEEETAVDLWFDRGKVCGGRFRRGEWRKGKCVEIPLSTESVREPIPDRMLGWFAKFR